MAIPIQKKFGENLKRERRRLEEQEKTYLRDIRRILMKALVASREADNGIPGAREERDMLCDLAIDKGLAPTALRLKANMTSDIAALVDRQPAQAHALGLLMSAADMLTEAGLSDDALTISEIVDRLNTANDAATWKDSATPIVYITGDA